MDVDHVYEASRLPTEPPPQDWTNPPTLFKSLDFEVLLVRRGSIYNDFFLKKTHANIKVFLIYSFFLRFIYLLYVSTL